MLVVFCFARFASALKIHWKCRCNTSVSALILYDMAYMYTIYIGHRVIHPSHAGSHRLQSQAGQLISRTLENPEPQPQENVITVCIRHGVLCLWFCRSATRRLGSHSAFQFQFLGAQMLVGIWRVQFTSLGRKFRDPFYNI